MISLVALIPLLIVGLPVAFALAMTGWLYLAISGVPLSTLSSQLFSSLNSSTIVTIPLFILAADLLARCGATRDLASLVTRVVGNDRGALPVVAVLSCTVFAAICGSSAATAAAIGVVLIPEMIRKGYSKRFSVGLIATAGGLGILIPPSIPFILYGMITETSVGQLFNAALLPGFLLAGLLCIAAYIIGRRLPVEVVANADMEELEPGNAMRGLFLAFLPVIVLGGIYLGLFTPVEAATISAVYAIALTLVAYRTSIPDFFKFVGAATATSSVILMILAGASVFGYVITAERIPHFLFEWISSQDLTKMVFLFGIAAVFIVAGMMLEVLSIILISMPILLPILLGYEINVVYFGILLILNMEIASITPPIGLNLFVISSISKVPVKEVFLGTLPFVLLLSIYLIALIFWVGMM